MYLAFDIHLHLFLHHTSFDLQCKKLHMKMDIHFHHYHRYLSCNIHALDIQNYQLLQNISSDQIGIQQGKILYSHLQAMITGKIN